YPSWLDHGGYRLPIEAEWEVACRGGTSTPRFHGFDERLLAQHCWYLDSAQGQSQPVGITMPNDFGMFDTLGNVSEWCYDLYAEQPRSHRPDAVKGSSLLRLNRYVVRGNDFASSARMLRAANRRFALCSDPHYSRGFRIARTIVAPMGGD